MDLKIIADEVKRATNELLEVAKLEKGNIFVLGCSTSEVRGEHIGKGSSEEIGDTIIKSIKEILDPKGIYLAVQGCEHINRALVVERELALRDRLEIVSVVPALHAGGSASLSAFNRAKDAVMVEHIVAQAGLDIGDTSIGMHVKFVQVPVRLEVKKIGQGHLTALRSRPKLIGGERAKYQR